MKAAAAIVQPNGVNKEGTAPSTTASSSSSSSTTHAKAVAVEAPSTADEQLERLRDLAASILSERLAASERVARLTVDITTREAAQYAATIKDDFEAAEALERPLLKSRAELQEGKERLNEAEAAVKAYESELLDASNAARKELRIESNRLIDERGRRVGEMRVLNDGAAREASATEEKMVVERERLAVDASRLSEDAAKLVEEDQSLEEEMEEGAKEDVREREGWEVEKEAAAKRVAELRAQLEAAMEEEARCDAKINECNQRVEAVRSGYTKQLRRLALRREALDDRSGQIEEAKAALSRLEESRDIKVKEVRGEVLERREALKLLHAAHTSIACRRDGRRREARMLLVVSDGRKVWEAAEAAAEVAMVEVKAEGAALRGREEAAKAAEGKARAELLEVRDGLKVCASKLPGLQEAKRKAVEGRAFKEAGRLAAEMKALAVEEEEGREREVRLLKEVDMNESSLRELGEAAIVAEKEEAAKAAVARGVLVSKLRGLIKRGEGELAAAGGW